jgi:hypothetical protein
MAGETAIEPEGSGLLQWDFVTRYVLVSKRSGHNTFSARYDDFKVSPVEAALGGYGAEAGHAMTLDYRFEPNTQWRFTLEWVHVRLSEANPQILEGAMPFATESLLQLSARYAWSNH